MNILVDGQTFLTPEINRGIGSYLKNTLNNLVKQGLEHTFFIVISNKEALSCLEDWVVSRIVVIERDIFAPSTDYLEKTNLYTKELEKVVRDYNIDIYWNPNPMMINVLFPLRNIGCPIYITMYDLIPLVMPIDTWPAFVSREYHRRVNFIKNEKCILLCISNATKNDVLKYIDREIDCRVTLLAADIRLFYKKCDRNGINKEPIMVFTGGFDYRKNIGGAIDAFIELKERYKCNDTINKLKFYIVCKYNENDKLPFVEKLRKHCLEEAVIFTGFMPDKDLSELYQRADLFFFPSLYEGFGLPLLEAMLAGCFVLSGDNSSLPEVCGGHAILFDVKKTHIIAESIKLGVDRVSQESSGDKQARQQYALQYTWELTAEETLKAFNTFLNKRNIKKCKIAIVTPWPNQQTGIANFVYMLMPYLYEYFYIDIFIPDNAKSVNLKKFEFGNLYTISELKNKITDYKEVIYHIGNNKEFHKQIYDAFVEYGGIAEIHDYVLNPFFYHSYYLDNRKDVYKEALVNGYGENGLKHFSDISKGVVYPDNENFPMSHSVASIAKGTIVHNKWSAGNLNKDKKIHVIPLSAFDKNESNIDSFSEEVASKIRSLENYDLIIGCFGFLNQNKRPEVTHKVFCRLRNDGYNIGLVFWGQSASGDIEKYGSFEGVFFTGYLTDNDYANALKLTDIVINLRYPSMGESSGTLCEAFKYGKPVIVSDVNQYQEFPNDICWKVPVNEYEEELLYAMLKYLIEHKDVRVALGDNAKNYADKVLSPSRIAWQYYNFIISLGEK